MKIFKRGGATVIPGATFIPESRVCFFVLGWLTHAALQIAKKTEDLSAFYMEQPCQTYEECLTVRKHTNLPFVIDESVTDLQSLVKG